MKESQIRQLERLRQDALKAGDTQKASECADQLDLDAIWRDYYDYDPVVLEGV